jgi:hypothetical protein
MTRQRGILLEDLLPNDRVQAWRAKGALDANETESRHRLHHEG